MSLHVIAGAGPAATATALRLAGQGQTVRLVSRAGTGPAAAGVEVITADAADTARLAALAEGAAVLYSCASPPYHRWPQDWPPLAACLLWAAERTGAVLVIMSNLDGYGPVGHAWHVPASPPMTQREIFTELARLAGAPAPRLRPVPGWQVTALGVLVPFLREFAEVSCQFTRPFVVDSAAFQATFGARPAPMGQALTATVTWWHDQGRTAADKE
ncbi:MAG: hypothetical protein ACLP8X_34640 [Streptosporangiaceae bacterium]